MKRLSFFITFICTIVCTYSQTDVYLYKDGKAVYIGWNVDSVSVEHYGNVDTSRYVDMGLPSGTLWATYNVGATKPEEYGDFYAYGETETKDSFLTSEWTVPNHGIIKSRGVIDEYQSDVFSYSIGNLTPGYDAATAQWGKDWRMPNIDECFELYYNTVHKKDTINGIPGVTLTSETNGKTMFLPAAGTIGIGMEGYKLYYRGRSGYYATSSALPHWYNNGQAVLTMRYCPAGDGFEESNAIIGKSVRPVLKSDLCVYRDGKQIYRTGTTNIDSISFTFNSYQEYEYVDLGLPSGTLWATSNVGTTKPSNFGYFFAWGETKTKSKFYSQYSFTHKIPYENLQTAGIVDNTGYGNLTKNFDAATMNWGGDWRLPTKEEAEELTKYCTKENETIGSRNGVRFTGPNGNSIFFPLPGLQSDDGRGGVNSMGYYICSTCTENFQYCQGLILQVKENMVKDAQVNWVSRYLGLSVRAVKSGK